MAQAIEAFESRWEHVNEMTRTFAEAVPDEHWESSPVDGFGPFNKQLRHVICVRGVYNDGLVSKKVDFGRKHEHYGGGLSREELLAALHGKHEELHEILKELPDQEIELGNPSIEFFGRQVSYVQLFYGCVQHEAIHHGQWSLYAAHGGFSTPELWRTQWGLEAGSV